MFNSLSSLRKITIFIYILIIVCCLYLIHVQLERADLPIKEIVIVNSYEHIDKEQINLIANRYLQSNYFKVDLNKIRFAFKKLPWVRDVSLRRKWPDKIVVSIEEHQVIARWNRVGLVNKEGEIFHAASEENLPLFIGNESHVKEITLKYKEIKKILEKEMMYVSIISLSERLSWEITTTDRLKINLGKDDILQKIIQFTDNFKYVISELKSTIEYVDLRYRDGFSVRKTNSKSNKKIDKQLDKTL
jgi:cell division protein FtsQ|tara:strand:- start:4871 stop:5608 length:738 start_codon:yes stop_codon:yes gene_type:complete